MTDERTFRCPSCGRLIRTLARQVWCHGRFGVIARAHPRVEAVEIGPDLSQPLDKPSDAD